MIYAVIDTNVIVSALITKRDDSPTRLILDYLFQGHIIPVFNDEILSEYYEVLSRKKFKLSPILISTVLDVIQEIGKSVEQVHCEIDLPDPKDVVFYEVSLAEESSYLVTGNIKHFPISPSIVTPSEMISIIEGQIE